MAAPDRPSPDALLRVAAHEGRGRLKVFLGAAPGVGKTYEMLREAAQGRDAGIDVVVGLVETHGRAETEAMTAGFEVVPRRAIVYEGRTLAEMDLDAILDRRPALALVDEFAHTNAAGSRHPKRWQDVEELLAAGIHVYTTLNVQHLESVNDVVASFTKVRVRETLPDRLLDEAELEVVDIPPDELIERLREGKVYVPEEATRALANFFSKSNLSALRELALRRAAQAVDTQMLDYLRAHAMAGSYAAGERVMVAVSEQPGADALVRAAKRLADGFRSPWIALHVETPRELRLTDTERERLAANLGLAATLGATIVTIPATRVMEGLLDQVVEHRVTQLVIGKSQRSWWFERRHGSVVDRIVRASEGVAIHVLPMAKGGPEPRATRHRPRERPRDYVLSLAAVATVVALGLLVQRWIDYRSVDLLFLLPTIAAASLLGLRQGLLTGVASGFAYNFFFIPPTLTFTIYDPQNVLTLFALIGVAVVIAQLAGRVRAQAELGARSARDNAAIASFAKTLGGLSEERETAQSVCGEVAALLDVQAVLFTAAPTRPEVIACVPPDLTFTALDTAAVAWSADRGEPTGRGTGTLIASEWRFHPLRTALGTLAVLGVSRADAGDPVPPHRAVLFMSLVDQAALAHERLKLEGDMREVAALRDRDALRSTLLSSLAHDLRTPLTAVSAGIDALAEDGAAPDLVAPIRAEAQRLARFFDDLIEIVRVEAGALSPKLEATDLTDAVAAAVYDVRAARTARMTLDVPPDLPLVRTDPALLNHMLINLIDNAMKHGGTGEVRLEARRTADGIAMAVLDEGPGLPPGHEDAVFETFTRIAGSDRTGGTGLGLAIVRGFGRALGIATRAANRADRSGARFELFFPDRLLVRGGVAA